VGSAWRSGLSPGLDHGSGRPAAGLLGRGPADLGARPGGAGRAGAAALRTLPTRRTLGARCRGRHTLTAAADHAGRGWAKERAVELYNEAFRLLPEGDDRRRALGAKRAVAFQALYHVPDAASLARRAEQ